MKKLLTALLPVALAGCLSVEEPAVSHWPVDFSEVVADAATAPKPAFGTVRLSHVQVRSPYDARELAVLRSDGTLAFDPYNEYAAAPALLLKGALFDALLASGRFGDVVTSSSTVTADHSAEIEVTRLCLDCREKDVRKARCELRLRLVRDRASVKCAGGSAEIPVRDGNYGAAFSEAVSAALAKAAFALD